MSCPRIFLRGALNGQLSSAQLLSACAVTPTARELLAHALGRLGLSARGYHKVLRIALSIADVSGAIMFEQTHIGEEIGYRALDRRVAPK